MSDKTVFDDIARMTESELLDYVISSPELLTDSYYREFRTPIYKRHARLAAARGSVGVAEGMAAGIGLIAANVGIEVKDDFTSYQSAFGLCQRIVKEILR